MKQTPRLTDDKPPLHDQEDFRCRGCGLSEGNPLPRHDRAAVACAPVERRQRLLRSRGDACSRAERFQPRMEGSAHLVYPRSSMACSGSTRLRRNLPQNGRECHPRPRRSRADRTPGGRREGLGRLVVALDPDLDDKGERAIPVRPLVAPPGTESPACPLLGYVLGSHRHQLCRQASKSPA